MFAARSAEYERLRAAQVRNETATAPALERSAAKIMFFGGDRHNVYLGCWSCSQYDSESVHSKYGSFGGKYEENSVLNVYGEFGSSFSSYSSYSPCNAHASEPPVIIDEQGNFYGRLTIDQRHPERSRDERINGWVLGICARH